MRVVIGLDVGTSSIKGIAVDQAGEVVAQASAGYKTRFPQPGWAEQNPDDWWAATRTTIRSLILSLNHCRIDALAVSSHAPALVPLGSNGEWLRPALIWMDRRALAESEELRRITGNANCDPYFLAPKALWMMRQEPELLSRVCCILQVNGYIVFRLTGALTMDVTHGGLTLLWDTRTEDWDRSLIADLGLPTHVWPTAVEPTEIVGRVVPDVAADLGLPPGLPVLGGAIDAVTAAMDTGGPEEGEVVEMTGTSSVLIRRTGSSTTTGSMIQVRHWRRGVYLQLAPMVAGAGGLRWAGEVLMGGGEGEDSNGMHARMEELASNSYPGSGGVLFLPYLLGERSPIWDPFIRGAFAGLSFQTTRSDLLRSIYEGLAFALRHNLEAMAETGEPIGEVRVTGGGANSRFWNQLKADVTGCRVIRTGPTLGSAHGAAILAGITAGYWKDEREHRCGARQGEWEVFEPDIARKETYDLNFRKYKSIYRKLKQNQNEE